MKSNTKAIQSYKGFDQNLRCRGEQFTIGETKSLEGEIKPCEHGYHACEEPFKVFDYYPPTSSRYCEVEQSGDMKREGDKIASRTIKVKTEIGIPGLVKAQIEYVKAHTTTEHTDPNMATAGNYGAATAGNYGAATAGYKGAATAGYKGAATAGDFGAATAGDSGAATAGDSGAATAGNYGAATAGYKGAATAGYKGAATAGNYGAATARGSSQVGENGLAVARGNNVRVKGGIGSVLVICEENKADFDIKEWRAFVVDGKTIKPDTWYQLKDGNIQEVKEGDAE